MTISYNKTWEVMNGLEEAFNKITTIDFLVEELNEAVLQNDTDKVADVSKALVSYLPVYVSHYEKASQRAWNNTVGEVRKIDNPYHVTDSEVDYDEIIKYEESLTNIDYNNIDLSLD